MIHPDKAQEYKRTLGRIWSMLGCNPPHPDSILRIQKEKGQVVLISLDKVEYRLPDSAATIELHREIHKWDPDSNLLKVVDHCYHYQPGAGDADHHSFRIDLDRTGLHANPDDVLVDAGKLKHRLEPLDVSLDISDFNSVLLMLVISRYRHLPDEYPLFREYGNNYTKAIIPQRERLKKL